MWTIFGRVAWSPCCKMLDIAHMVQKTCSPVWFTIGLR